jgi:single-strand DNA-binding protein
MTLLSGNGRPKARPRPLPASKAHMRCRHSCFICGIKTPLFKEIEMNNSVSFAGYVGNAPVEKIIQDRKLAIFSLAVKQFKSQGEEETMWIEVEAWEKIAGRVIDHVTKGREVLVNGRLALSTYIDKDGVKVIKPVVKLAGFYLCGPRPTTADEAAEAKPRTPRKKAVA